MNIDVPFCDLKTCLCYFDGNCTNRSRYDVCPYVAALKALNMCSKRVSVETPYGELVAEAGCDEVCYPEIFVYLKRDDEMDVDLVYIGVDVNTKEIRVYHTDALGDEEYRCQHTWTGEEVKRENLERIE